MKILSIDTAHGICSVAIAASGVTISVKTDTEPSAQAEHLFYMINDMLKENSLSYDDLGAIGVDVGPGSFTGVRIGLAASRGIALAANIPVIGITGFEALAHACGAYSAYTDLLVVLNARRGQVFAQFFGKDGIVGRELLLDYNEITTIIQGSGHPVVIGDGALLIQEYLPPGKANYAMADTFKLPDAHMIAMKAFDKISHGNYASNPSPLYIRKPDAKMPGTGGLT